MGWIARLLLLAMAISPVAAAEVPRTPAPNGAEVYFITPGNGEKVKGIVRVRFGLRNMGVAPAGVEKDGTGHHHLLIDAALPDFDVPIPNDERHRHFGGGQTEVELKLSPGRHTLQLILGDFRHIPHTPPVLSEQISVTVE